MIRVRNTLPGRVPPGQRNPTRMFRLSHLGRNHFVPVHRALPVRAGRNNGARARPDTACRSTGRCCAERPPRARRAGQDRQRLSWSTGGPLTRNNPPAMAAPHPPRGFCNPASFRVVSRRHGVPVVVRKESANPEAARSNRAGGADRCGRLGGSPGLFVISGDAAPALRGSGSTTSSQKGQSSRLSALGAVREAAPNHPADPSQPPETQAISAARTGLACLLPRHRVGTSPSGRRRQPCSRTGRRWC